MKHCLFCNKEYFQNNAKFCSRACNNRHNAKTNAPKLKVLSNESIKPILNDFNNGIPLKQLANQVGCCKKTLKRSMVAHGLWKDRPRPQHMKGFKSKRLKGVIKGVINVSILIRDKYRRDVSELKKTDDNWHWSKHRVVVNHMADLAIKRSPERTLRRSLRVRLWKFVSGGNYKSAPTMKLVGCSSSELRARFESMFRDGMSWRNYGGSEGWEIDHIKPCTAFDLSKPIEQSKCFHFSNLQPLWKRDNIRKGGVKTWIKNQEDS